MPRPKVVLRKLLDSVTHHRGRARVRVLYIEDGVVPRLLGHLGKIEVEGLIVACASA